MGEKIGFVDGTLVVPDQLIIPYIRGDGIGVDITPVMQKVINAAVKKTYCGIKKIHWFRLYAGADALDSLGIYNIGRKNENVYLPNETVEAIRNYRVTIKGPLTTPIGGGIRSLNVAIRQMLDLYACVRPVKWYRGVPAPLVNPEDLNVIIFRENTEDVYAGIEWAYNSDEAERFREFLDTKMGHVIRKDSAIGVKPISLSASKRLVRSALDYAVSENRSSVTLVHKGNIMKYTEGAFRNWGYEVAIDEYRDHIVTEEEYFILKARINYKDLDERELLVKLNNLGYSDLTFEYICEVLSVLENSHGWDNLSSKIVVKDRIADQMFQQLLLRPKEYDVIATTNLNGDYISDACAAEVGGLGIAPCANINYKAGIALFEATHGSAPKYAGLDMVNPTSIILSAVMMLKYIGWFEAADLVEHALVKTFEKRKVTYDLHRLMVDATLVSTSQFGDEVIDNL